MQPTPNRMIATATPVAPTHATSSPERHACAAEVDDFLARAYAFIDGNRSASRALFNELGRDAANGGPRPDSKVESFARRLRNSLPENPDTPVPVFITRRIPARVVTPSTIDPILSRVRDLVQARNTTPAATGQRASQSGGRA